jgi:L-Ala-D/L-Glu epimerase
VQQTRGMVITSIETERVVLPLRETFRTAVRETDSVEALRVTLRTDDGQVGVGYGTATPAITGDTLSSMDKHIESLGGKILIGRSVADELFVELSGLTKLSPSGTAAIDMAVHSLGTAPTSGIRVQTSVTISAGSIKEMVGAAVKRVEAGFTILKLKLGADPDGDLGRLMAITDMVDGRATIWVDANQGWTREETFSIMDRALHRNCAPEMLEQPVRASAVHDLAEIAKRLPMPITADESVKTIADIEQIASRGGVDAVNIKLMKFGGLTGAAAAVKRAHELGLSVLIGSMMEHPASVAAAVRFASSLPEQIHDLDAAWWFADTSPLTYADSYVCL